MPSCMQACLLDTPTRMGAQSHVEDTTQRCNGKAGRSGDNEMIKTRKLFYFHSSIFPQLKTTHKDRLSFRQPEGPKSHK